MLTAANLLGADHEFLLPVASTLDQGQLKHLTSTLQAKSRTTTQPIHLVPDAREALHHARASVVASGTATVQAAVMGNPFVVVYRVSPLTFALAKRLVRYPAEIPAQLDAAGNLPIAMVNLIAAHRIIPELLQDRFTAENVVEALLPLLTDAPQRRQMIADLAAVGHILHPSLKSTSIQQVCDAVEALLPGRILAGGPNGIASV